MRERAEPAEHLVAGDEWRHHHRGDAEVLDDAVRARRVPERGVGRVVRRDDHAAGSDRPAEHADARRELESADPRACARSLDASVMSEAQVAALGIDQVDHRPVGIEQSGGLLDRGGEQAVDGAGATVRVALATRGTRASAAG